MIRRPAVFLDRDGTLNRERGFVTRPEELEVFRNAVATSMVFSHVVLVPGSRSITIQSGCARLPRRLAQPWKVSAAWFAIQPSASALSIRMRRLPSMTTLRR